MRLLVITALLFGAHPAVAQSIPDWARPSSQSSDVSSNAAGVPNPQGCTSSGSQPKGCSGTTPVPVDGGLLWLALGGAGLAARRLRQSRED